MVENAIKKPDLYGKVLTATLHVDEGTPHVDFMTSELIKIDQIGLYQRF